MNKKLVKYVVEVDVDSMLVNMGQTKLPKTGKKALQEFYLKAGHNQQDLDIASFQAAQDAIGHFIAGTYQHWREI